MTAVSLHLPAKGHLWSILVSNIIWLSSLSLSTFSFTSHIQKHQFLFSLRRIPVCFFRASLIRIKAKVFPMTQIFQRIVAWTLFILIDLRSVSFTRGLDLCLSLPALRLFDLWSFATASSYSSGFFVSLYFSCTLARTFLSCCLYYSTSFSVLQYADFTKYTIFFCATRRNWVL